MALITSKESNVFDTNEIKRGDMIRLKFSDDANAINGIVAKVTSDTLSVFYLPETANVTNYINIRTEDVNDWAAILWSSDLETIKSFEGGGTDGTA